MICTSTSIAADGAFQIYNGKLSFPDGTELSTAPKDGTIIHSGNGSPPGTLIGNIGDYYIDNTNHMLYGPYNGSWGTGVSLVGPAGPGLEAEAVILFANCPVGWTAYSPQPSGIVPLIACFQSVTPGGCGLYSPVVYVSIASGSPIVGSPVTISVIATDEDNAFPCNLNQAITVRSEFVDLPPMSTTSLTPSIGFSPTFVPDVPGNYIVRVRASDDTGRSSFVNVTIAVGLPL